MGEHRHELKEHDVGVREGDWREEGLDGGLHLSGQPLADLEWLAVADLVPAATLPLFRGPRAAHATRTGR